MVASQIASPAKPRAATMVAKPGDSAETMAKMAGYLLSAFQQGDKSVIFEDAALKCGLIRTITEQ